MAQNISIPEAVRVYYEKFELGTADICILFGCKHCKALQLKKEAQEYQIRQGMKLVTARTVSTRVAFEAWGYDIRDLEERMAKLRRAGVLPKPEKEGKENL